MDVDYIINEILLHNDIHDSLWKVHDAAHRHRPSWKDDHSLVESGFAMDTEEEKALFRAKLKGHGTKA
ncbi:hypothetical protein V2J09_004164 [Rumex salicifolius]